MHDNPDPSVHLWRVRSSHCTSEGTVTYEACHCGRWRVVTWRDPYPESLAVAGPGRPR